MQKFLYPAWLGLLTIGLGVGWLSQPASYTPTPATDSRVAPQVPTGPTASEAPVQAPERTAVPRQALQALRHEFTTRQQQQHTELRGLQQRLDRLTTAHSGLHQQLTNLTQPATPKPPEQPEVEEADTVPTDEGQEHAHLAAFLGRLEGQLAEEAADPAWSTWAEDAINGGSAHHDLPGATSITTTCRTTLCRIEVAFADGANRAQSLESLPSLIPWDVQGFFHLDPATNTVVLYATREGETFPTWRQ